MKYLKLFEGFQAVAYGKGKESLDQKYVDIVRDRLQELEDKGYRIIFSVDTNSNESVIIAGPKAVMEVNENLREDLISLIEDMESNGKKVSRYSISDQHHHLETSIATNGLYEDYLFNKKIGFRV